MEAFCNIEGIPSFISRIIMNNLSVQITDQEIELTPELK
jgi:hypothetical protein